jgi:hypothetical protein
MNIILRAKKSYNNRYSNNDQSIESNAYKTKLYNIRRMKGGQVQKYKYKEKEKEKLMSTH